MQAQYVVSRLSFHDQLFPCTSSSETRAEERQAVSMRACWQLSQIGTSARVLLDSFPLFDGIRHCCRVIVIVGTAGMIEHIESTRMPVRSAQTTDDSSKQALRGPCLEYCSTSKAEVTAASAWIIARVTEVEGEHKKGERHGDEGEMLSGNLGSSLGVFRTADGGTVLDFCTVVPNLSTWWPAEGEVFEGLARTLRRADAEGDG